MPRPDAPERDGAAAMADDMRHALSLDQVGNIYAERGFPRSQRSLQRFCASGHLDCQKVATTTGDKYLVAPYSVERHLTQLKQLAVTESATGPGLSRQFATPVAPQNAARAGDDTPRHEERQPAPGTDVSAHDAGVRRDTSQLVEQLEKRVEEKNDEIRFLREELEDRRNQIRGMKSIIDGQNTLLEAINRSTEPVFRALASSVTRGETDPGKVRLTAHVEPQDVGADYEPEEPIKPIQPE
ncbi:MAG: hypothetical protein AB7U49_08215 [Hyphomicrobiaceae bacterium]